jgi:hypothetical protein
MESVELERNQHGIDKLDRRGVHRPCDWSVDSFPYYRHRLGSSHNRKRNGRSWYRKQADD